LILTIDDSQSKYLYKSWYFLVLIFVVFEIRKDNSLGCLFFFFELRQLQKLKAGAEKETIIFILFIFSDPRQPIQI